MWRKQLHTLDHPPLLVIVEPILTWLEAGNDGMPCFRRMLGRMLARRTVAAADVPTLRTPTEMKPPASRGRQALDAPVSTRLRIGVDSALVFSHFQISFRVHSARTKRAAQLDDGIAHTFVSTAVCSWLGHTAFLHSVSLKIDPLGRTSSSTHHTKVSPIPWSNCFAPPPRA